MVLLQGAQVRSLVGELRYHVLCGVAKKKNCTCIAPTIHMYSYHAVWGQQSHKEAEHKPRCSSKEIYKPPHLGKADWVNSDRSETVEEP